MFCPKCGAQLSDNASFCSKCGAQLRTPAQNEVIQLQPQQPAYVGNGPVSTGHTEDSGRWGEPARSARGKGIAAIIFASIGYIVDFILIWSDAGGSALVSGIIGIALQIPGFILAIIAIVKSANLLKYPGSHRGNAIAGLVLGILAMLIILVPYILLIFGGRYIFKSIF